MGELLQRSPVATGKNCGCKTVQGDMKTPEGIFKISEVVDANEWKHDFKDDTLGEISGAYGPFFIRLDVPGQKGIGIHGTHDNSSLCKRASEGCIRMKNEDLVQLVSRIKSSSIVIITPGQEDVNTNNDTLHLTSKKQEIKPLKEKAIIPFLKRKDAPKPALKLNKPVSHVAQQVKKNQPESLNNSSNPKK